MNVKTIKPQTKLVFTLGNLGWSKFNSNCQNISLKAFSNPIFKKYKTLKKKNGLHHVSYKISESLVIVIIAIV